MRRIISFLLTVSFFLLLAEETQNIFRYNSAGIKTSTPDKGNHPAISRYNRWKDFCSSIKK
jgi:hypothetical protein